MNNRLFIFIFIAIVFVIGGFFFVSNPTPTEYLNPGSNPESKVDSPMPLPGSDTEEKTVFCTQDAKLCPDGSYVSRVPPNCEFAACPTPPSAKEPVSPPDSKISVVSYSEDGFSPKSITINKGDTVLFKNDGGPSMWVASDPHPTHTAFSAFDQRGSVSSSQSWSFTFDQSGTWQYHNHNRPSHTGAIVVK